MVGFIGKYKAPTNLPQILKNGFGGGFNSYSSRNSKSQGTFLHPAFRMGEGRDGGYSCVLIFAAVSSNAASLARSLSTRAAGALFAKSLPRSPFNRTI